MSEPLHTARPLPWGVYLACSWTWCIGMFLPALLLRDLGVWSFVAFALPNIIGAAALAWVMPTPDSSRELLREHRVAVWAFSALTIAFHVYFAAWIGRLLPTMWGLNLGWALPVLLILSAITPGALARRFLVAGFITWALSAAGIVYLLLTQALPPLATHGTLPSNHLWPMAVVCALGFLLCPYLDATFHRARIECGGRATAAFSLGFGWFFPPMILGTLVASPLLLTIASGQAITPGGPLLVFLLLCTGWQLLYTVRAHAMERPAGKAAAWRVGLALPAAIVAVLTLLAPSLKSTYADLTLGEIIYRAFMGLYGLVFPAYFLCCMWPVRARDGLRISTPTAGRVAFWIAAVAAGAPFYTLAFIHRQTWWALPGVAVVLVAWLGATASARRTASTH